MSLHQLVLVSYAASPLDASALRALGQDHFRRNSSAGISGMLMHHEGSFVQLLEGDAASLKECLQHLQRDKRHRGIQTVLSSTIDARGFDDWSEEVIDSGALAPDIRSAMEQITGPSIGLGDDLLMAGRAHRVLHGCRVDALSQNKTSATPPNNAQ